MNDLSHTASLQVSEIGPIGLVENNGEPRARDLDIAERLGFSRPRTIRQLIERNKREIEAFGTCCMVQHVMRGNPVTEYWLNEEQALLVATLSSAPNAAAVRAMLIKAFVAWRRGQLAPTAIPPDVLEYIRRTDGISRMLSHKVTEMEKAIQGISSLVQPNQPIVIRQGKTAGQILKLAGYPPMKGLSAWFSRRLRAFGCSLEYDARAEMGLSNARLYDPDKAAFYLESGGDVAVKQKISERRGQGTLRLVKQEG